MTYRFHKDIVHARVCGVSLLITLRDSWDRFPAVKQMSPIQGCFCRGIEQGMSEDELMDFIILPDKLSKETVRARYRAFVRKMVDEGYLIPEETEHGE